MRPLNFLIWHLLALALAAAACDGIHDASAQTVDEDPSPPSLQLSQPIHAVLGAHDRR